jgi:N-acetylmuramoyl-L-alanine amidase
MTKDWVPYVVRKGDTVAELAFRRGATVAEVWNHEKNAELKARRKNPDVLALLDIVYLPPPKETPLDIAPGDTLEVSAKVPRHKLKLKLCDAKGKPLAGEAFEVEGGEPVPRPGKTDGAGVATFTTFVTTRSVKIKVPSKQAEFLVSVAGLDPVSTRSGAEGRLRNIGLLHDADGDEDVRHLHYREALFTFQEMYGLEATGELDEATQKKLDQVAGDDGTSDDV